ncbi:MAG: hypothetical protein Q8Q48_00395 [Candidatus Staskawiczbacteria bacterium]|nr:hypothetical protein [Candidatus Staskawiczbacteria bacterium]
MENRILIIPKKAKPIIDRTELGNGSVFLLLCLEAMPIWVAGIVPGSVWDMEQFAGWVAFERPVQKVESAKRLGVFFPERELAVIHAEEMITFAQEELFPGSH